MDKMDCGVPGVPGFTHSSTVVFRVPSGVQFNPTNVGTGYFCAAAIGPKSKAWAPVGMCQLAFITMSR